MRVAALCVGLATSPAWAHHDTAVGRVGGAGPDGLVMDGRDGEAPRLELGMDLDVRRFARTLKGSDRFAGPELVAVDVVQGVLRPAVRLRSPTRLGIDLPVGVVRTTGDDRAPDLAPGMGDVRLWAAHRLVRRPVGDGGLSVWVQAGLWAPTGRYVREAAVSLVDVQPGEGGALDIVPYDTRASLGAGAWVPTLAADTRLQRGRLTLQAGLGAQLPVTDTPDDIRWGADLQATLQASVGLAGERLRVGARLAGLHHTADRLEHRDPDTGTVRPMAVGRRSALQVGLTAVGRLSEAVSCGVEGEVPVVQHVQGTQLVASLGATARCRVAWGLGAPRDRRGGPARPSP
jgi:hypothetical protein